MCGHQDDRSRVGLVARQAITRAVHEAAYEGEEVGCRLAGARGCGGQHISACVWKYISVMSVTRYAVAHARGCGGQHVPGCVLNHWSLVDLGLRKSEIT